jgi:hypothetical protein
MQEVVMVQACTNAVIIAKMGQRAVPSLAARWAVKVVVARRGVDWPPGPCQENCGPPGGQDASQRLGDLLAIARSPITEGVVRYPGHWQRIGLCGKGLAPQLPSSENRQIWNFHAEGLINVFSAESFCCLLCLAAANVPPGLGNVLGRNGPKEARRAMGGHRRNRRALGRLQREPVSQH